MNITPQQRCINLACDLSGTLDEGDTARFWGQGDETVGSTNNGVAAGIATLAGGLAADYTIVDTAAAGFSIKPTRPGIYYVTMAIGSVTAGEATKIGISLDSAVLADTFVAATAGMRAFIGFEATGPVGTEISCMIPFSQALIDGSGGLIRFQQDVVAAPEYSIFAQVQRIANFDG